MCGFFFTNRSDQIKNTEFVDVKQRGKKVFEFNYKNYYGIQSILPTCSGEYANIETDEWKFFYTGQVYNYSREYLTDTYYVFDQLIEDINNVNSFNGMFAFLLLNKNTNDIYIGRDKTGQIPLFFYNNEFLIVSNTIKSIIQNVKTSLRKDLFAVWSQTKHYISKDTPWNDIAEFPSGYLYANGSFTKINGPTYNSNNVYETLLNLKNNYTSPLPSYSIASGGVDSSIVAEVFDYEKISLNNVGKDRISNKCSWSIDIDEQGWCKGVEDFIEETYNIPYSWSHVSYFILGKYLKGKAHVLLTGEGADEIFGGYPGYAEGTPTPYSGFLEFDKPIENKIQDQNVFIPVSSSGANIALGCSTIEPRSPFLDLEFLNNENYINSIGKPELVKIYQDLFNECPKPKQGFSGFPNEFYNYRFKTDINIFDNNSSWKTACIECIKDLTS